MAVCSPAVEMLAVFFSGAYMCITAAVLFAHNIQCGFDKLFPTGPVVLIASWELQHSMVNSTQPHLMNLC